MNEKQDFHIKADKNMSIKAKKLSGLTNREIYELGCKFVIEKNKNILDSEIIELHDTIDKLNELTDSIKSKLKDKEVPTRPSDSEDNNPDEFKRNILPLDLLEEMLFYYMDDYNITDLQELNNKNKEIFRFVLINLNYYKMSIDDVNKLYERHCQ